MAASGDSLQTTLLLGGLLGALCGGMIAFRIGKTGLGMFALLFVAVPLLAIVGFFGTWLVLFLLPGTRPGH